MIKNIRYDFHRLRKEFIEKDLYGWLRSNYIYNNIDTKINSLLDRFNIFIVTNKDEHSVEKILNFFDIKIDIKNIYGKELKKTKSECLEEIIKVNNCNYMAFIDDQVENLLSINISEIKRYLATWGYNNSVQIQKAVDSNILPIGINEFPKKIVNSYK